MDVTRSDGSIWRSGHHLRSEGVNSHTHTHTHT